MNKNNVAAWKFLCKERKELVHSCFACLGQPGRQERTSACRLPGCQIDWIGLQLTPKAGSNQICRGKKCLWEIMSTTDIAWRYINSNEVSLHKRDMKWLQTEVLPKQFCQFHKTLIQGFGSDQIIPSNNLLWKKFYTKKGNEGLICNPFLSKKVISMSLFPRRCSVFLLGPEVVASSNPPVQDLVIEVACAQTAKQSRWKLVGPVKWTKKQFFFAVLIWRFLIELFKTVTSYISWNALRQTHCLPFPKASEAQRSDSLSRQKGNTQTQHLDPMGTTWLRSAAKISYEEIEIKVTYLRVTNKNK